MGKFGDKAPKWKGLSSSIPGSKGRRKAKKGASPIGSYKLGRKTQSKQLKGVFG